MFPSAKIAPALAVGLAGLVGVIEKMLVAIAVQPEVPNALLRQTAQRADAVAPAVFGAVGPGLKAVHENLFIVVDRQGQRGRDGCDLPLGQRQVQAQQFVKTLDRAAVFPGALRRVDRDAVCKFHDSHSLCYALTVKDTVTSGHCSALMRRLALPTLPVVRT